MGIKQTWLNVICSGQHTIHTFTIKHIIIYIFSIQHEKRELVIYNFRRNERLLVASLLTLYTFNSKSGSWFSYDTQSDQLIHFRYSSVSGTCTWSCNNVKFGSLINMLITNLVNAFESTFWVATSPKDEPKSMSMKFAQRNMNLQ